MPTSRPYRWLRNILIVIVILVAYVFLDFSDGGKVYWWPVTGKVLDAQSGEPIAGAHVVALWKGREIHSNTVCFHVEAAVSDAEGRYRISGWLNPHPTHPTRRGQIVTLHAHKPGYEVVDARGNTRMDKQTGKYDKEKVFQDVTVTGGFSAAFPYWGGKVINMRPFSGDDDERMVYLRNLDSSTNCRDADDSYSNHVPFSRLLYEEALQLKLEDSDALMQLKSSLNIYLYGAEEAQKLLINEIMNKESAE